MATPTTPSFFHGKNSRVFINGFDLSIFFRTVEFTKTKETVDATTFTSRGKRFVGGFADSTISAEGLVDQSPEAIDEVLDDAITADAESVWSWFPDGLGFESIGYGAPVIDTSHSISGGVDDVVATAVEGQPTAARERLNTLQDFVDLAITTTGAESDNLAPTSFGGAGYLQMVEADGAGTVDVTIEMDTLTGMASPTTLITFATVSAVHQAERISLASDALVEQFTRSVVTIAGFTRVKLLCAFHRTRVAFT